MLRVVFALVLLATAISAQPVAPNASDCKVIVTAFLSAPNRSLLGKVKAEHCATVITASNAYLEQLDGRVAKGNRAAATLAADNLKFLDGGNLEDALIALGRFSERDMFYLLGLVRDGHLSHRHLADSLTMLPLAISDDHSAQLNCISRRRRLVTKVEVKSLEKEKILALKALDDFAVEIRAHKN